MLPCSLRFENCASPLQAAAAAAYKQVNLVKYAMYARLQVGYIFALLHSHVVADSHKTPIMIQETFKAPHTAG